MSKLFLSPSVRLTVSLLLFLGLTSCGHRPISNTTDSGAPLTTETTAPEVTPPNEPEKDPLTSSTTSEVSEAETSLLATYTFDELSAAGERGGCGMTLLAPGTDYYKDGIYFFHGMDADTSNANSPAYVKINDEITPLPLTAASGETFYGQHTSQTFQSEEGETTLQVEVTLGAPGEIESVAIETGTLTIQAQGQTETIAVTGDAGC